MKNKISILYLIIFFSFLQLNYIFAQTPSFDYTKSWNNSYIKTQNKQSYTLYLKRAIPNEIGSFIKISKSGACRLKFTSDSIENIILNQNFELSGLALEVEKEDYSILYDSFLIKIEIKHLDIENFAQWKGYINLCYDFTVDKNTHHFVARDPVEIIIQGKKEKKLILRPNQDICFILID